MSIALVLARLLAAGATIPGPTTDLAIARHVVASVGQVRRYVDPQGATYEVRDLVGARLRHGTPAGLFWGVVWADGCVAILDGVEAGTTACPIGAQSP